MKKVIIINYNSGNIFNVARAFRYLECDVAVVSRSEELSQGDYLVLPGVGAFGDGMAALRERQLVAPLLEWVDMGRPLLGICLGMQMLLESSEEFGQFEGLGIVPGSVKKLSVDLGVKVPNIGWHALLPQGQSCADEWRHSILHGITSEEDMYFVHSYGAYPHEPTHWLARTQFGVQSFCSVLRKDNVYGCQFHPEKSAQAGLRVLRNFLSA
jgi:glutamine amidotransferase